MTKRVSRRAVNTGIGATLIAPTLAATRAVAQAGLCSAVLPITEIGPKIIRLFSGMRI